MTKYTLRQEFPYPLKTVIRAREHRYDELHNQPGLKSQELLGTEHDGPVVITKRLMKFGETVPDIIKKMVPAALLQMTDTNYFNTETHESKFTMLSDYAPDKVKISGVCPYVQVNENLTYREYELTVEVNVPLVGKTIEKAIADSYRDGLEKDHQIMLRACARL